MCALFGTSHRLAAYKQAGNEVRGKYKLVDAIRSAEEYIHEVRIRT